jgi:hypothetical protein
LLFSFTAAAAARFVASALVAAVAGGCTWWPDVQERADVQFGPEIDRTKVSPSLDLTVLLTDVSSPFTVVGAVTDADTPVEALFYQWFVAYPEREASERPRGPDFLGQPSIRFIPCQFRDVLSPFAGNHVLELIVSDQPIEFDPEGGRIIKGGYAYVSWTFDPRDVVCPP